MLASVGLEEAGLQAVMSAALPNPGETLVLDVVDSRECGWRGVQLVCRTALTLRISVSQALLREKESVLNDMGSEWRGGFALSFPE